MIPSTVLPHYTPVPVIATTLALVPAVTPHSTPTAPNTEALSPPRASLSSTVYLSPSLVPDYYNTSAYWAFPYPLAPLSTALLGNYAYWKYRQ